MNGAYKSKNEKKRFREDNEYTSLKQDGVYILERKEDGTEKEKYFNYNLSESSTKFVNNKRSEDILLPKRSFFEDRKEHNYFSEMLREDRGLEEALIESYHEIGEIDLKDLCEISLKLGCISFGGPLVHQDLIRRKFVKENKYLTEKHFKQILNLCLVLPGYSSSTLIAAIAAIKRKSILGGLLAMILFNIPSFVAVLVFSLVIKTIKREIHAEVKDYNPNIAYFNFNNEPFLYIILLISTGITQAALGLMIQAAYGLSKKLSYAPFQFGLLVFAGIVYYLIPIYMLMVLLMIICGLASAAKGDHDYLLDQSDLVGVDVSITQIKYSGLPCLIIFFIVYGLMYIFDFLTKNIYFFIFESFFRIGSLSFGEGHVIIPMILTEYTNQKLLHESDVLDGYALISLLPGSMFNLAAYTGVICLNAIGGIIANIAIFMPGFLFVFAALPYMNKIKTSNFLQFFIRGACSAAIGFVFTATIKLWINSCFMNPYSNPIIGTLNVFFCYILVETFKAHKPYVVLFGAVFIMVFTRIFFKNEIN